MNIKDVIYAIILGVLGISICCVYLISSGRIENLEEKVSPMFHSYEYGFSYWHFSPGTREAVDNLLNRVDKLEERMNLYNATSDRSESRVEVE